jgi:beta-phosphoglucomutase-like phosphatase (HAD superfamily)
MSASPAAQESSRPAVLFDLDGRLIGGVYQHVVAWREALAEIGKRARGLAHSSRDRNERRPVRERSSAKSGGTVSAKDIARLREAQIDCGTLTKSACAPRRIKSE